MRVLLLLVLLASLPVRADDIEITADLIETDRIGKEGPSVIQAHGDVQVRSGALRLFAPELEWRRDESLARLKGGVSGASGQLYMSASSAEADLQNETVRLEGGEVVVKREVSASQLEQLAHDDPMAARACGINALTLRAEGIGQSAEGVTARGVWLTTCECPTGCRPMLSVSASSVEVVPGERATFRWPVFWLFDFLPVTPPLPQLTLPLVERKSGLLFPRFSLSGPAGMSLEVPYFFTLGRSADLTLSAGVYRGSFDDDGRLIERSVRGFGASSEWRWRPAEHAWGSAKLQWLYDFSPGKNGAARGSRGSLSLEHEQSLLGGRFIVESQMISDSSFLRDTSLLVADERPYLPTRLLWSRSGRQGGLALSATHLQDIRADHQSFDETNGVLSPLVQLIAQAQGALGPAFTDGTLTVSLEDSIGALDLSDAREPRVLSSLRFAQTLPIVAASAGHVSLEAGERLDLLMPFGDSPRLRFGAFGGLWARTRIGRTFDNGLRHELTPALRLRGYTSAGADYASSLFARGEAAPQSPVDAALPGGSGVQLVTRLATSLSSPTRTLFRLALEHHAALDLFDAGQIVGELGVPLGPLGFSTRASMRLNDSTLTSASAQLSGAFKGARLALGGDYYAGATDDRIARGLDLLFTPASTPPANVNRVIAINGTLSTPIPKVEGLHLKGGLNLSRSFVDDSKWRPNVSGELSYEAGGCGHIILSGGWVPERGPLFSFGFEFGDLNELASTLRALSL